MLALWLGMHARTQLDPAASVSLHTPLVVQAYAVLAAYMSGPKARDALPPASEASHKLAC